MIRVLVSVALAMGLGLTCSYAHAQTTDAEARQHYVTGQKLFDQASYSAALDEFERSYRLSHYPAILYKMALCRDQLGPPAQAIAAYQRYLDADPKSSRKAGIEARIAKLKALAPPIPAPTHAAPSTPAKPTTPTPTTAKPAPLAAAPAAALARPATPPAHTPVYKKWWLWTIVGVAVAGAAVGLGIALAPPRAPNDFQPSLGRVGLLVGRY